MSNLRLKRGNTLSLQNTVTDKNGPVNISGWDIKSQIRDGEVLVADLKTTVINAATGSYELEYEGSTADWPGNRLKCDIKYTTASGHVVSTETFFIDVEQGITV